MSNPKSVTFVHTPYQGNIGARNMKYSTLYQGTITPGNMRNHRQYQGSVNSRNLKHGRLYQGTIQSEGLKPKTYGKTPDRTNPYRYYTLSPNYYGPQKGRRKSIQGPNNRGNIQERPPFNKRTTNTETTPAPTAARTPDRPPVDTVRHKPEYVTRQDTVKLKKEPNKTPTTAARPQPQQTSKPQIQKQKLSKPITPFPPPSPEPVRTDRQESLILPVPPRYQALSHENKPEAIFPPIMPVSLKDYVKPAPTRRTPPERARGNPLVPVMVPDVNAGASYFNRRNRSPTSFTLPRENYNDSFNRSFTGVPGYNAVGSLLRSMNMYDQ